MTRGPRWARFLLALPGALGGGGGAVPVPTPTAQQSSTHRSLDDAADVQAVPVVLRPESTSEPVSPGSLLKEDEWGNSFPTPAPTASPTVPVHITEKALEMQTAVEREIENMKAKSLMTLDSSKTNFIAEVLNRLEQATSEISDVGRQTGRDEAALQEGQDEFSTMLADAKDAVKTGTLELRQDMMDKRSSLGRGLIKLGKRLEATARRADKDLADTMDNAEKRLGRAQYSAEKAFYDAAETSERERDVDLDTIKENLMTQRDANADLINGLRRNDQGRKLRVIERRVESIAKRADKKIEKATEFVTKRVTQGSQKTYYTADKIFGKTLQKGDKKLSKKQRKLLRKLQGKLRRFLLRSAKKYSKEVKRAAKGASHAKKSIDRSIAEAKSMESGLYGTIDSLSDETQALIGQNGNTMEVLGRITAAVPSAVSASTKGIMDRAKEAKKEGREITAAEQRNAKATLEQAALESTDQVMAKFGKLSGSARKGVQELTQARQETLVKTRDEVAVVQNKLNGLAKEQDAAGGKIQEETERAMGVASGAELSEKRLLKKAPLIEGELGGAARNFIQATTTSMQRLGAKMETAVGGSGDGLLEQAVTEKFAKLKRRLDSEILSAALDARQRTQDLAAAQQQWMLPEETRLQNVQTAMGVGDKASKGQSVFTLATANLPISFQKVKDAEATGAKRSWDLLAKLEAAIKEWEGLVQQHVHIAADQGRSFIVNQVSQAEQVKGDSVGKAGFEFSDQADTLQRDIESANERSTFKWAGLETGAGASEKALADLANNWQHWLHEQAKIGNAVQDSPVSRTRLAKRNQIVLAKVEKGMNMAKRQLEQIAENARTASETMVTSTKDQYTSRVTNEKQLIHEQAQGGLAAMKEAVAKTRSATKSTKVNVHKELEGMTVTEASMKAASQALRTEANSLIDVAGSAHTASLKKFGSLRVEQTAMLADEGEKLGTMIHLEMQKSRTNEQRIMHTFGSGASQMHHEQDAFAHRSSAMTDAELKAVGDHASAAARHRDAASTAALDTAERWATQSSDDSSQLVLLAKKAQNAAAGEAADVEVLSKEENTNQKRMKTGMNTMVAVVGDNGDRAADNIRETAQEVSSQAEIARVDEETRMQEVAAQEKLAAEMLHKKGANVAQVVNGQMAGIQEMERGGDRGQSVIQAKIEELEALVVGERGALDGNRRYLRSYIGQSAAALLNLLTTVISEEMRTTHQAIKQKVQVENNLAAIQKLLRQVTGGEAFKTLESIADVDELAVSSASMHEKMEFWLMNFDRDQKGYEKRVEQGFSDGQAMQRLAHAAMDQDRMEQEQHGVRAAGIMDKKTRNLMAAMGDANANTSALDGALASNVQAMKDFGIARAAADNQLMGNMENEIDAESDRAREQLDNEKAEFSSIREEHQAAKSKIFDMRELVMATQRLQENRLAAAKAVLDDRAKAFSDVLLLGGDTKSQQPPDLVGLKAEAKRLEKQHEKLTARHASAETIMALLIGALTEQLQALE